MFVTKERDYLTQSSLSNDTLGLIHLRTKPVPLASGNAGAYDSWIDICFLIYAQKYKGISPRG